MFPGSHHPTSITELSTLSRFIPAHLFLGTLMPRALSKHFMAAPTAVSSWYTFRPPARDWRGGMDHRDGCDDYDGDDEDDDDNDYDNGDDEYDDDDEDE